MLDANPLATTQTTATSDSTGGDPMAEATAPMQTETDAAHQGIHNQLDLTNHVQAIQQSQGPRPHRTLQLRGHDMPVQESLGLQ